VLAEDQSGAVESKAGILSRNLLRMSPYYGMFYLWSLGTGAQQLARPLFAFELGATPFLIVLITGSNAIAKVVSAPITGFLTDRLGRKPLVLVGNGIRGLTCLGQFFAESYLAFFVLEFIGGIGVAMFTTSGSIVMADFTTTENRGRLMAIRGITSRIGTIMGPATGALNVVFFNGDLRYIFLFNAATKVVIHVTVAFFAKETAPEEARLVARSPQKEKLDISFFRTKAFWALMITSFSLSMMGQQGAFGALFPVQAKDEVGLSASEVGNIMSLAGFIGLILTYPNGWAVDRFGRKPTLIPGLLLLALSAVVLANLDSRSQILLMVGLYGLGHEMSMGSSQAFAADLAPPDRRGSFLGLWSFVSNLGAVIAPLAIGAMATSLGYGPGYLMVASLLAASAFFMLIFGPETGVRKLRAEERASRAAAVP
jgi:MFS family permease